MKESLNKLKNEKLEYLIYVGYVNSHNRDKEQASYFHKQALALTIELNSSTHKSVDEFYENICSWEGNTEFFDSELYKY